MKKLMVFLLSLGFLFIILTCLASAIRINEVMPHINNTLKNEWVELYNPSNETANLNSWKIGDLQGNNTINLTIFPYNYSFIVDNTINYSNRLGCQAVYYFLNDSNFSCFELNAITSRGLNDSSESLFLYDDNSILVSNLSWNVNIKKYGNSWQFYNETWQNCTPTPGRENFCQQQNITQNTTTNSSQNKNSSSNQTQENKISLGLDWDEDDIVNGEDFDIEVEAYNLKNEDYDIKIYISPEDDNTMISETYNEEDDKWKSSTYYVENIISGSGDKSATLSLRIKSTYRNFSGDAEIIAKIRKSNSSSIINEVKEDIEVLKNENDDKNNTKETQKTNETSKTTEKNDKKTAQITGEIIKLGNRQAETENNEKVLYESSSEKIKKYAIFGLNFVLIVILAFLLMEKIKRKKI